MSHDKGMGAGGARVARAAGFIITVVVAATMVASCTTEPGENTLPCGVVCTTDEVVHCGQCVTPVKIDQACVPTPCDPSSVCEVGSCVQTSQGWQCKNVDNGGLAIASECNPDLPWYVTGVACPANTWCRDGQCMGGGVTGRCTVLQSQGDFCDSDLHSVPYGCNVCTHESTCINGVCLADCTSAAECPCDDPFDPYECEGGHCVQCRDWGESCDPPLEQCCAGPDLQCQNGTCCRAIGGSCTTAAECCGTTTLCLNGVCTPCQQEGEPCTNPAECCPDVPICADPLLTGSPTCFDICTTQDEGQTCETNLPGVCAVGKYVCVPDRQGGEPLKLCWPDVWPGEQPEICDGLDNDCNGEVDDNPWDVGMPCQASPSGCVPAISFESTYICENGQKVCEARLCDPDNANDSNCYCMNAGAAIGGHGKPCGVPKATPCIPGVDMCIPNFVCAGAGGMEECNEDPVCPTKNYTCWTPDDIGIPPPALDHCWGI